MTTEKSANLPVKSGKKKIPTEIKNQILERVKEGKKTIKEIAEEHGIAAGTIYAWLSESAGGDITKKDFMDVHRENKQLKELLGALTLKMSTDQKKVW